MSYCEECLKEGIYKNGQLHHIAHRSTSPCMKHVEINFKYLCLDHHTGAKGVHHHPEIDRQYKQELELKLKLIFTKEFYTYGDIKEILKTSDNSTKAITKTLFRHKEGYKTEDLIRHMLGGHSYL